MALTAALLIVALPGPVFARGGGHGGGHHVDQSLGSSKDPGGMLEHGAADNSGASKGVNDSAKPDSSSATVEAPSAPK